jgi:hypothetical protein
MNGHTNGGALSTVDDHETRLGISSRAGQLSISTHIQMMAAMTDQRVNTAKAHPRSVAAFKRDALQLITEDVETAKSAEYAKPVGKGVVRGPSIRLVEIAANCWGNLEIDFGEPVVGDKSVTVTAYAYDLEKNIRQPGIASTSILYKDGGRYPQHMIETIVNATASKARRNAILAVIPRAYINTLLEAAKKVAAGTQEPFDKRRQKTLAAFATTLKVTPEQVFAFLEITGEADLTEEHLDTLRPIFSGIRDGEAKVEEFFATASESKLNAVRAKVEERRAAAAPKQVATSPPVTPPSTPKQTTTPPSEDADDPTPAKSSPATDAGGEPRPDHQQFRALLERFEKANGDAGAWLSDHNFADEGQALASSKPHLSKLISQLDKDCVKQEGIMRSFAGGNEDPTLKK